MYKRIIPGSEESYSDWYIKFASNRVVLAYNPESQASDEVTVENWYEIITRPDVKFGLPDPRMDAAGYRSLMIVQLAESFYHDPTIFERVYLGRFKVPITVEKSSVQQVIQVPELLEPIQDSNIIVRGGSVALLALLESGDIDYVFEYESVARQHGLNFIDLPPALNLGDPSQIHNYEAIQVRLDYQRFSSVKPEFDGDLIGYGATIPANAPNPLEAQAFLNFIFGPQGSDIMEANKHPIFAELSVDNCQGLPVELDHLCD
jgi:molybdate/tungstate transport system substrate-binding protein